MQKILFILIVLISVLSVGKANTQDSIIKISSELFNPYEIINLSNKDGWLYRSGNDPGWADQNLETKDWQVLKPSELTFAHADESGKIEGWFRAKIRLDSTLEDIQLGWRIGTRGALALYIDGKLVESYGQPHTDRKIHENYFLFNRLPTPTNLKVGQVYDIAIYLVEHESGLINKYTSLKPIIDPFIRITGPGYIQFIYDLSTNHFIYYWLIALVMLSCIFWFLYILNKSDRIIRLVAILTTLLAILCWAENIGQFSFSGAIKIQIVKLVVSVCAFMIVGMVPMIIDQLLTRSISKKYIIIFWLMAVLGVIAFFIFDRFNVVHIIIGIIVLSLGVINFIRKRKLIQPIQWVIISGMILTLLCLFGYVIITSFPPNPNLQYIIVTGIYLSMPVSMLIYFTVRYNQNLTDARRYAQQILKLSSEKEKLIESQKKELEVEVKARTLDLEKSLTELKATQAQLIQQEKLASLGQLTAGIAHEIKNPLNFVNNFSEVSIEMIDEALVELAQIPHTENVKEVSDILSDIKSNLNKINQHGTRADGIVKSMLMHSRGGSGKMEPTDLNEIIKEYVHLAFHGMRASKNPINVSMDIDLDENVGKVPMIAEDFSRVILNLSNNAFDAMKEKVPLDKEYTPKLTIRTKKQDKQIIIEIEDNGPGIPDEIKDKILQPFFTTKKGTEGTGLGLSITNDIVKAHGGEMKIVSEVGRGTEFIIVLPVLNGK